MTKHRWEGSFKSLRSHIDPDKDEHLKWMKLDITSKVKKILKLAKNINPGNKEGNLKKKAELINLIEDFQQQYDSLYSLYESLRGEVKKNIKSTDDDSSPLSTPDSESYFSPEELSVRVGENIDDISRTFDVDNQERETSDKEYTVILEDKLTSTSEVKNYSSFDSPEVLKDLRIQEESSNGTNQDAAQIRNVEQEINNLKLETGTLFTEKKKLEEQVEWMSKEAVELEAKISRLEAQISESESKFKDNEFQYSSLKKQLEVNEQDYISRVSELVAKSDSLQIEVNNLQLQKGKLEEQFLTETDQNSRVKGLLERINFLEKDLAALNSKKNELELEHSTRSEEMTVQIEMLQNKLNDQGQEVRLKELEMEIHSLSSDKSDLEQQLKKINQEVFQSNIEKQELQKEVQVLQTALSKQDKQQSIEHDKMKEHNYSTTDKVKVLENKLEVLNNERKLLHVDVESLQKDKKRLQLELEEKEKHESSVKTQLEKKNTELTNKISDQQKSLLEVGAEINKLRDEGRPAQGKFLDSKSNLQLLERKVDDIAEEFRQQFEAKYTILSRRIRVAEQLHVENKEWFMKSKDRYEQENRDLKEKVEKFKAGMKSVKDMSLKANDVLTLLDTLSLKFEECMAHFLNRISKSSCELKFVKDWATRKNRVLSHVKDELECLVKQLDVKESEILAFRERVWRSENKVRELEKMVEEKDDEMMGLQEEKREAIRQLCIWIDYHRSRSEYYMKMVTEMNPGRKRSS